MDLIKKQKCFAPPKTKAISLSPDYNETLPRYPQYSINNRLFISDLRVPEIVEEVKKNFRGFHIYLLNFASSTHIGGGVTNGAKAQEEDLIRAYPMLYLSLLDREGIKYTQHSYRWPKEEYSSPNWWNKQILVTEIEPNRLTIISSAAPNWNSGEIRSNPQASMQAFDHLIFSVLQLATLKSEYAVFIGGMWGCGVFHPKDDDFYSFKVATMFMNNLSVLPPTLHLVMSVPPARTEPNRSRVTLFKNALSSCSQPLEI